ncbi:MAG: PTS sugar transporter subunit IIA [Nitrospirota bacterium]
MKISELVDEESIIEELNAVNKQEVLDEFSELLKRNGKIPDGDALARVLSAREALGSTGIGDGVAIPHGKLPGLKGLAMAFGRSRRGINFDSLDGQPAKLFFLLVAPEDAPGEHLKALARISRLMKNGHFRDQLVKAEDKAEIKRLITKEEELR